MAIHNTLPILYAQLQLGAMAFVEVDVEDLWEVSKMRGGNNALGMVG